MKLETIEGRVPEQWRFFLTRSSSMDSSSESSTMMVDDLVKDNNSRQCRHVRICEKHNTYHSTRQHEDLNDERILWYSSLEMDVFRAQTRIAAKSTLSTAKKGGDDWPLRLEQTYNDICNGLCVADVHAMPTVTPSMVGLERRMLARSVGKDRDIRRDNLLKHFRFIVATGSDPEQQQYSMALASKTSSKPGCAYAAFCAKWWWEQGDG